MKKIAFLLAFMMIFSVISASATTMEFTIGSNSLYVRDGELTTKTLEAVPYIDNGRTMVPVRVISENLGATVDWEPSDRSVTIKNGDTTIVLYIDNHKALLNGDEFFLDAAPTIKNDVTMVPIRFISERLKKNVEFVEQSTQVLITDQGPIMTINEIPFYEDDFRMAAYFLPSNLGENITTEELLAAIKDYYTYTAVVSGAAKEKGLTLSVEEKDYIVGSLLSAKENYYPAAMVATCVKSMMQECYAELYLKNYKKEFTEEEVATYFKDNFFCAKHILISTVDTETGETLSDTEKKAAKKKAETVLSKAKSGSDFDLLVREYGEDPGTEKNPDGYVFTDGEMVAEFEEAVKKLKEGAVSGLVETEYGYHIIKRLPLPSITEDIASYAEYIMTQQALGAELEKRNNEAKIVQNMDNAALVELLNSFKNNSK